MEKGLGENTVADVLKDPALLAICAAYVGAAILLSDAFDHSVLRLVLSRFQPCIRRPSASVCISPIPMWIIGPQA